MSKPYQSSCVPTKTKLFRMQGIVSLNQTVYFPSHTRAPKMCAGKGRRKIRRVHETTSSACFVCVTSRRCRTMQHPTSCKFHLEPKARYFEKIHNIRAWRFRFRSHLVFLLLFFLSFLHSRVTKELYGAYKWSAHQRSSTIIDFPFLG